MTVHLYLRRSKEDAGKQEYTIDVQRDGCHAYIDREKLGARGARAEYVDEGKSGDDFHSRAGLRKLLANVRKGDVVICRDQSRLGRDAIEVTLVVRDLVRDRGCRLFYYATGHEVQFENAIDQAMTFIQGTGHQMELEAIRSRTREALRARARAGRIAGGRCYGYELERRRDESGRSFTVATVDPGEAAIIVRIFRDYLDGRGIKAIAIALNNEGVPSPMAGRRGTGSWSPGAVRVILQNPRYRGLYLHGKVKKVRRAGKVERVKADASETVATEIPEWRIVDDETWFAVQEKFRARTGPAAKRHSTARYPLSGIARCATCNGPVYVKQSRHGNEFFKAYGCGWHHSRGAAVCPVTVCQRTEEVEGKLIDLLKERVLTPAVVEIVIGRIRHHVEAQMPRAAAELAELDAELREVAAEQRRLAKAVALSDDVGPLVDELQARNNRIRALEAQIAAAKRTPAELAALIAEVEREAKAKLEDLKAGLGRPADRRQVFQVLFPDGVKLTPARTETRQVWSIEAKVSLESLKGRTIKLGSDPDGNRTRVFGVRGRRPRPLDDGAMKFSAERRRVLRARKS